MFNHFPKVRSVLPDEYQKIYTRHYKENREGQTRASSLSQKMEAWAHKQVARDVHRDPSYKTTLEIGAGTLNQLGYEPEVGPYDIVEPFRDLYQDAVSLNRIRTIYTDTRDVPQTPTYDRILSIGTFEHICNLPEVVARVGLLLTSQGVLRVAIPSEGTPLWTLGWKLTTGLEFRLRYGLDYGVLMKYEHVNTAKEIEAVLCYFFNGVEATVFGLCKPLSLYQFYGCTSPVREKCHMYLESI